MKAFAFEMHNTVEEYATKWSLDSVTPIAATFTSEVYRVRCNGSPAVLKVFTDKGKQFESGGAVVLDYFGGNGSVRLLKADEGAHLLEYVDGQHLSALVSAGDDNAATHIICDVVNTLHACDGAIPDGLISMERNFRALFKRTQSEPVDSIYVAGARVAERLIASEQELRVLHGDIHHENIIESSKRGWLAIDPQCVFGERTYDVVNALYNPNGFDDMISSPETIMRRCTVYAKRMGLDEQRILQFAFAYGCLSAAWNLDDGFNPDESLRIAQAIQSLLR